jgi:hypothetical protein
VTALGVKDLWITRSPSAAGSGTPSAPNSGRPTPAHRTSLQQGGSGEQRAVHPASLAVLLVVEEPGEAPSTWCGSRMTGRVGGLIGVGRRGWAGGY